MKLKICGLKENTAEVSQLLPDYIGLIFWEGSKRFVLEPLDDNCSTKPERVGVFVNASEDLILQKTRDYNLDLLQLHGSETPEFCFKIKSLTIRLLGKEIKIIKAFAVDKTFNFEVPNAYLEACDFFLFDSRGPLPGGNGTHFNWTLLQEYKLELPYFLSGGISLRDEDKLIEFLNHPASAKCHALDVNSGFETSPGCKDIEKLKQFINSKLWPAGSN
jgi:phosphoribosylanthranilate isomerase